MWLQLPLSCSFGLRVGSVQNKRFLECLLGSQNLEGRSVKLVATMTDPARYPPDRIVGRQGHHVMDSDRPA
jgi:hypothetical protein